MNSAPSATKANNDQPQAPPRATNGTESLVREAFDDIALVIGGVSVLHHLDDDLTWTLMKRLDRIRVRLLRDLKGISRRDEFEPTVGEAQERLMASSPLSALKVPGAAGNVVLPLSATEQYSGALGSMGKTMKSVLAMEALSVHTCEGLVALVDVVVGLISARTGMTCAGALAAPAPL